MYECVYVHQYTAVDTSPTRPEDCHIRNYCANLSLQAAFMVMNRDLKVISLEARVVLYAVT